MGVRLLVLCMVRYASSVGAWVLKKRFFVVLRHHASDFTLWMKCFLATSGVADNQERLYFGVFWHFSFYLFPPPRYIHYTNTSLLSKQ